MIFNELMGRHWCGGMNWCCSSSHIGNLEKMIIYDGIVCVCVEERTVVYTTDKTSTMKEQSIL